MSVKSFTLSLFFTGLAIFSFWLMWHTFSYNSSTHQILISAKAWSDFGWMLPLARSFSLGQNWPPQNPFYSNSILKYHFLFHLIVGVLERLGVRIDLAFNLLSGGGFFFLLVMIWKFSSRLFSRKIVGFLSILLFLFNSSLSFIEYFTKHGWSLISLSQILTNSQYPSFGPWDGSSIAAIWNLNIFTNQRPLGLSLGLLLLAIYLIHFYHKTSPLIIGTLISLIIFLDQGLLPGLAVLLAGYFIFSPISRPLIFKASLFTLPWAIISLTFINTGNLHFHPGFLTQPPFTFLKLFLYWLNNLGLSLFLIPIGFFLAPKSTRILIPSLMIIFLLPNLFQFSPDMFNNHKLFNLFIIFGNMFTAWVIVSLWKRRVLRLIVPLLLFLLTFSGLIDFFALKNDSFIPILDYPQNPDISYIYNHTSSSAVFLNSTWFYHPASLAGRSIFSGYPYFTWAHGYDPTVRESIQTSIFRASDKTTACRLLSQYKINYIELSDHSESYLQPNLVLWRNSFTPIYHNPQTGIYLYDVSQSCRNF